MRVPRKPMIYSDQNKSSNGTLTNSNQFSFHNNHCYGLSKHRKLQQDSNPLEIHCQGARGYRISEHSDSIGSVVGPDPDQHENVSPRFATEKCNQEPELPVRIVSRS